MRRVLAVMTGAAAVVALAVAPGTAQATAAPTSSTTWTQTLHGPGGASTPVFGSYTGANAPAVVAGVVTARLSGTTLRVWPRSGERFTVGSDAAAFATGRTPIWFPSDHLSVELTDYLGLTGCTDLAPTASVDVVQADYDAAGTLVAFAGHVRTTCRETGDVYDTDIRVNSTVPTSVLGWFGETGNIPVAGLTVNPILVNAGTTDVALGALTLSDATSGWSAVADAGTCGAVLPARSECRPHVVVTGSGSPGGILLHVATPGGPVPEVPLWLHSPTPIPDPTVTTRSAGDGVHVAWDRATTPHPAQVWDVYRSDAATGPWTLLTTTTGQGVGDTTVAPGATAYYYVVARRIYAFYPNGTSAVVSGTRSPTATVGDGTGSAYASTSSMAFLWSSFWVQRALEQAPEGPGTYAVPAEASIPYLEDPGVGACLRPTGTLVVRDLVRLASGAATILDATLTGTCDGGEPVKAEVRVGTPGPAYSRVRATPSGGPAPTSTWLHLTLQRSDAITNDGATTVTVGTPSLVGAAHRDEWDLSTSCNGTLAPHSSCTITTRWTPTAAGAASAQVHVDGVGLLGAIDLPIHVTADVDATPPTVGPVPVLPPFVGDDRSGMLTSPYSDGQSGPGVLDVRERVAGPRAATLSAWVYPKAWRSLPLDGASTGLVALEPGRLVCLSFRAHDKVGNLSAFVPGACTSRVWDDPVLTPTTQVWTEGFSSSRSYNGGTWSLSRARGATLLGPLVNARKVAVLVTTCPTCGSLDVYVGSTRFGTVSTRTSTIRHRVMLVLPARATAVSGRLRLVVHSSGLRVIVDGVGSRVA